MTEWLVSLKNVSVTRGRFTLDIPTLQIPEGCVVGVIGPNGAGKSTLLELIPGLLAPDRGEVRVFGLDPMRHPREVRSRVGYMTDTMPLFLRTIDGLLAMLSDYYASWDGAFAQELVQRFGLDRRAKVHQLSKGQGTLLRLITALAFRPRLLVLDEPATGLDVKGRRALLEQVLGWVADERCSAIVSSHQVGDVERIADQLVWLEGGRIRAQGPIDALLPEGKTLEELMLSDGAPP